MEKLYLTIGMAGHIDHGKTTLTKALTGIDTDRLKAEKERGITIELGFAPLELADDMQVSIIDVPGHEKLIRQMIAGVAGIDLALLAVAADEGVMPQTKEHLEILTYLGVQNGLVVVTKTDKVEEDLLPLVVEEIEKSVAGTPFQNAEVFFVDSVSGKGIAVLKDAIKKRLQELPPRKATGAFRMAIDQVFTIQGQGTVVRGTVSEGSVRETDKLLVLPQKEEIRVRQLQVQHERVREAMSGQRAALNIAGLPKQAIKRGDVLVGSESFSATRRLDVALQASKGLSFPLKQRVPVKVHIGTAIVMGRIIFFDRNEWRAGEEVICQLELDEAVVAKRRDRLIVRRPTPVETVGGGWVIDAVTEKHRFGEKTMAELKRKKEGSPETRLSDLVREHFALTIEELSRLSGLVESEFHEAMRKLREDDVIEMLPGELVVLTDSHQDKKSELLGRLAQYHEAFPLRAGMEKTELVRALKVEKGWSEAALQELKGSGEVEQRGPYLAIAGHEPTFPKAWARRMEDVVELLKEQNLEPGEWRAFVEDKGIPEAEGEELKHYLLWSESAYKLDEDHLIHREALLKAVRLLREKSAGGAFPVSLAKETLGLSRKHLIPLLELLDRLKLTLRDQNVRKWINKL